MDIENFPQEVLKFHKLRSVISKAWLPMGISRDEAVDILIWAVGEDVSRLHFSLWAERIKKNTGINFNEKEDTIFSVMRKVAETWNRKKIHPVYVGG